MKTQVTSAAAAFYRENGYIVLERVVPAPLIDRLRAVAEEGRGIARRLHGPQVQRLQPMGEHVDIAALREFVALPDFVAAIRTILSERHYLNPPETMAVLFEPAAQCWATEWHRDVRDHMLDEAMFKEALCGRDWTELATNPANFNQFNCALYEDTSTWFVPGSHARMTDTPGEIAAARAQGRAAMENKDRRRSEAEQELAQLEYCRAMPGAVQVILQPGDLVLYRNTAWHLGAYVPYRRRATLHGQADTPEFAQFKTEFAAAMKRQSHRFEAAKQK